MVMVVMMMATTGKVLFAQAQTPPSQGQSALSLVASAMTATEATKNAHSWTVIDSWGPRGHL